MIKQSLWVGNWSHYPLLGQLTLCCVDDDRMRWWLRREVNPLPNRQHP